MTDSNNDTGNPREQVNAASETSLSGDSPVDAHASVETDATRHTETDEAYDYVTAQLSRYGIGERGAII